MQPTADRGVTRSFAISTGARGGEAGVIKNGHVRSAARKVDQKPGKNRSDRTSAQKTGPAAIPAYVYEGFDTFRGTRRARHLRNGEITLGIMCVLNHRFAKRKKRDARKPCMPCGRHEGFYKTGFHMAAHFTPKVNLRHLRCTFRGSGANFSLRG